jgi:flap endonuclease-1
MGTTLNDILKAEGKIQTTSLVELSGRELAVDAFNTLYQFLSIIRQRDGTPLMDSKGRVTSHLSGLFYRNLNLLEHGIKPVYVFDGISPKMKRAEMERRRAIREKAHEEWEKAKEEGRIEDAFKAATASSRLTTPMIDESKKLLEALGVPVIQAPSEGEALAAEMARNGLVWASASQDNDSLLYNCPRMIRNLSISGRRRGGRAGTTKTVHPELIDLDLNLRLLKITRKQLIDIAILVGTDYNDKVKGVGQKTALKLIRKHGDLESVEKAKKTEFEFPYQDIRNIFLNPPTMELKRPQWTDPDWDQLFAILCDEHDFARDRIQRSMDRIEDVLKQRSDSTEQASLNDFF